MNRCVLAIALAAIVLGLTLSGVVPPSLDLIVVPAIGATWVAASCGGLRVGLPALALGALLLSWLRFEPQYSFRIERPHDQAALLAYVVTSLVGCWVAWIGLGTRRSSRLDEATKSQVACLAGGLPPDGLRGPVASAPNDMTSEGSAGLRSSFGWLAGFVAANLVAAWLGHGLKLIPGVSIIFWPPSGIFIAALLLSERRTWPGCVAAAGVAELTANALWFHNPLHLALLYFAANTAEALTAALLVCWAVAGESGFVRPRWLEYPRNAALFAVLAGAVAPCVGATIIATADALLGKHDFATAWPLVWLGDATGLLFAAPLTLAAVQTWRRRDRIKPRRAVEFAGLCAVTALVAWLALRSHLPTVYLTLPTIVWAAVRFQVRGAWVALAALVLTVAFFTRSGVGEFAGAPGEMHQRMVALQVFLGVCALTGLIVAGLSARHVRALERLRTTNKVLERRVQERTAALREGEERLRLAVQATGVGILDFDPATRRQTFSDEAMRMWGFDAGTDPTPERVLGAVHPDDRAAVLAACEASLQPEGPGQMGFEHRVVRADGAVRWLATNARTLFENVNGQKRAGRSVGTMLDITERKQAEERLRESEARFSLAVRAVTGVVWEWDLRTGRVFRSDGLYALVGVRPEEAGPTREWWAARIHPDDLARLMASADDLLANADQFSGDYRVRHEDGRWIDVWERGLIERDAEGRPQRLVGFTADVTERKRAMQTVEDRDRQLRMALDASLSVVFQWDIPEDRVQRVQSTESVLPVTGGRDDTFEGVVRAVAPEDKDLFRRNVRAALESADGDYRSEHRIVRPDGTVRWLAERGRVEFDAAHAPLRLVGISSDITERKEAEETLRRSQLDLSEELRARSRLQELSARLVQQGDLKPLLQEILAAAAELSGTDKGNIQIYDPAARALRIVAHQGLGQRLVEHFAEDGWVASCGEAASTVQRVVVHDVERLEHLRGTIELEIVREDGIRSIQCTPLVSRDGRLLGILNNHYRHVGGPDDRSLRHLDLLARQAADLIERHQAAERLRESEEKYRRLLALLPVGVYTVGAPDGTIAWYNDHAATLWGRRPRPDDTEERFCGSFRLWTPDGSPQPHALAPMAQALGEGRSFRNLQVVIERPPPDSSRITVLVNIDPIRNQEGAIVGAINVFHDVSAQHAAEQALRASEERLRHALDESRLLSSIVESSDDAIISKSLDGVVMTWNAAAERLFGFSRDEMVGRLISQIVPPDRTSEEEHILALIRAGEPVEHIDTVRLRKDGQAVQVSLSVSPVRDEQGRVIRASTIARNITERKRAEEQLRRSEEQFRSIFNQSVAGIAEGDLTGRFLRVNQRFCEITGRTEEELRGARMQDITHVDDLPRNLGLFRKAVADGTPFFIEKRYVRPDGSIVWVNNNVSILRDREGRPTSAVGVCTDVTAQRRTQERSRLLSEAAAIMLTTDDPNAMLRGVYEKIAPHLGLDAYFNFMADEESAALRLASCVGVPEDVAESIERLEYGQAVCGTVAVSRQPLCATRIQQSDDAKVQLVKSFGIRLYACNPLMAGDRLLGTLSFASRSRDEFDAAELEFLRTICHYVAMASERLRLVRQLQEADQRKDEFLATLAHELRNPLAPIRNGLEFMKLVGDDPQAAGQARGIMERQVEQMTRLIDDLMDVSRISCGKVVLRKTTMPLADAVRNAVDTSRPLIDAGGHTLTVDMPPAPIFVDGDLTRLSQVFANLLNNAAKYTDRGGRVRLSVERDGTAVAVCVEDNGVGIAPQALGKVFDLFSQVDRSLEKAQGGLGIGLNIVRRLVEMHDGSITVQSDGHGQGSRFTVRLPIVETTGAEASGHTTGAADKKTARRRILVVDDNVDGALSLAMMLKMLGNETRTAHDGLDAVTQAESFHPDVILMDIGMPRLNGYDACRRIRERPEGRGSIIVACTGWGQDDDRRKATEAGFDFHMTKPINPNELESMLAGSNSRTRRT